jgi:uncharacterized protein (DUF2235 family)
MDAADTKLAVSLKKRIVICLDGTWNTVTDNTNVWRLKSLLSPLGKDGLQQIAYYSTGVGTALGMKLRGGMFGYGLNEEIIKAYEWLIGQYNTGDDIFIFGFSRGAYTARSLSGFISKCGLLQAGAPLSIGQLYERYRRGSVAKTIRDLQGYAEGGIPLEEQWMLKYSQAIDIHFLGVWDSVGALGLPFGSLPIFGKADMQFLNTGIRRSNKFAFHALAVDEHRKAFAPTLWTVDFDKKAQPPYHQRTLDQVEQRWFVGAHANVGGGCRSDPLAQLPLKWLQEMAMKRGLAFRREVEVDTLHAPAPISDSYSEFMRGAYKIATWGNRFYRDIGADAAASSVTQNRISINETIDRSVFERWRADVSYRPSNLQSWANRKKVHLEELARTVRADDPAVPAEEAT